ncbi:MAG TPA: ABC transporter substrate-binding protein [Solirubrobacteraceae bacterium]|jgi:putative hydroxymethylpyrimidine transport system substrate-binding protein
MLLAASLIATVLCAGCGEAHFPTKLGPARPLTVAIDGPPSALYAPLYAARANGDFRLGALAVSIAPGSPAAAMAALESHRANVAIVSEPQLLEARDSGAQVVAIGALVRQPLEGIISPQTRPITGVAALARRTLAIAPGAFEQAELATALTRAHVSSAAVKRVALGAGAAAALPRKGVAATLGANWALAAATLAQMHQHAHVLQIQNLGVPSYSQLVIAVRVGEAHHDGPLLRAFLQSLTRGQRAAQARPAALAAMLARANPSLTKPFELALLHEVLPLASPSNPKRPFGYPDPYAWQAFGDWMHSHGLLAHPIASGLAITDEFLPGLGEATVVGD